MNESCLLDLVEAMKTPSSLPFAFLVNEYNDFRYCVSMLSLVADADMRRSRLVFHNGNFVYFFYAAHTDTVARMCGYQFSGAITCGCSDPTLLNELRMRCAFSGGSVQC